MKLEGLKTNKALCRRFPEPEPVRAGRRAFLFLDRQKRDARVRRLCISALVLAALSGAPPGSASQGSALTNQAPTYLRDILPILMGKCARCHNQQTRFLNNWLDYPTAFAHRREIARRVWDSWKGSYYKGPMPVPNGPESQAITRDERLEVRNWVIAGAPRGVAPPPGGNKSKAERIAVGGQLFASICAACHQPRGQGLPNRFPPLAASDFLNADKNRAIKTVIHGRQGEVVVNGMAFNESMPSFPLSDEDIANVLTFVYNSFGNSGMEVKPEEVKFLRAQPAEPNPPAHETGPKAPVEKSPFE